jgi:methyltransferase family protein
LDTLWGLESAVMSRDLLRTFVRSRIGQDRPVGSLDLRGGLPRAAVERISAAVLGVVPDPSGVLLDVGVGTGEIGACVALSPGVRYLGLDLSLATLRRFEARLYRDGASAWFLRADADRPWPIRDGRVRLFFLSRAAHLLRVGPLVTEVVRTAHPDGAWVVLGRVRREASSVRATLRRALHRLLGESGVESVSGETAQHRLAAALAERGGTSMPAQVVATWTAAESPAGTLAVWREKPSLAGLPLPAPVRNEVLDRLEAWARRRYGDLDTLRDTSESYEISAIRLPTQPWAPPA